MAKTTNNKTERFSGVILTGLLLASIVVSSVWFYHRQPNKTLPLENSLYVTDWNVTKIYGPGTPQQAAIVEQLKSTGEQLKLNNPALYRMGATAGDSDKAILLMDFDPKDPKTAHLLKQ